jgi:gamma-glutamylcyclotransferase (GGCT)/AIG2-like uncharacterized protein YtfP
VIQAAWRAKLGMLNVMENLFSYGTLQQEKVQSDTFGYLLEGKRDVLQGYCISEVKIKDKSVIKLSGKEIHPILIFTGNIKDEIEGTVFRINSSELLMADKYEVDDYSRVEAILKSGTKAWIYVGH